MAVYYEWQDTSLLLHCHLQPGASRDEIAGVQADRLKIRIKAPPVDGKANKQLITFIAKQFGVKKSAVAMIRGKTSRQKTLCIAHPQHYPAALAIQDP